MMIGEEEDWSRVLKRVERTSVVAKVFDWEEEKKELKGGTNSTNYYLYY